MNELKHFRGNYLSPFLKEILRQDLWPELWYPHSMSVYFLQIFFRFLRCWALHLMTTVQSFQRAERAQLGLGKVVSCDPVLCLPLCQVGVILVQCLLMFFYTSAVFLFIGTCMLGLCISSVFPSMLAFTEDILDYKGETWTWLFILIKSVSAHHLGTSDKISVYLIKLTIIIWFM